jgi:XRE family transcriptional regulator, aerobic/anaerobic benzoate catabolism transcriptional regulator
MGDALSQPLQEASAEDAFLARIGERVRAWRGEHGATRKALAARSGLSERYLAQLETGRGNISVLLLRKLARAMELPVETLLREHGYAPELAHLVRFIEALPPERVAAAPR